MNFYFIWIRKMTHLFWWSQFNWRRDGGDLPQTAQLDRNNRLILQRIRSEDIGRYICQKTEPNGQVSENYLDVVLKREYRRRRHLRNFSIRWQWNPFSDTIIP